MLRNTLVGTASAHPQRDFHDTPDQTNSAIAREEFGRISARYDIELQITGRLADLNDGFRSLAANSLLSFYQFAFRPRVWLATVGT